MIRFRVPRAKGSPDKKLTLSHIPGQGRLKFIPISGNQNFVFDMEAPEVRYRQGSLQVDDPVRLKNCI